MAKEATIKKQAIKQLEAEGYIVWCPAKVRYYQNDIFGIFDCVAVKDSHIRWIQWTSHANVSARKKKIQKFFDENNVFIGHEVWGHKGGKEFSKHYI